MNLKSILYRQEQEEIIIVKNIIDKKERPKYLCR